MSRLRLQRVLRLTAALAVAVAIAVVASSARAQEPLSIDLGEGVELELVPIKPGRFLEGSPLGEAARSADEGPREVTLTRGFYLGKYPVTRGQFARFVNDTGYRTEAEKGTSGGFGHDGQGGLVQKKEFNWKNPGFVQTDDHPVTIVTYDDALAFTGWLGRKVGREVGLPTEAQFEYAARAGTKTRFYGGDADGVAGSIGWLKTNAGRGTQPVGKKAPNAFGLFDTSGNVYQWCRDWYGAYPPGAAIDPEVTQPPAGEDKPRRVLRGGSWLKEAKHLRSAARYRNTPGSRNADNGFRVAASLEARAPTPAPTGTPAPAGTEPSKAVDDEGLAGILAGAMGLVVGGGCCFGLVALILFLVLRGRKSGVSFRPGADGFWVDAPAQLRGAVLGWQCQVGGATRHGTVVIEPAPGGQFVYTGGTPTGMRVASLERGTANRAGPARWHGSNDPWDDPHHHRQQPFRGYPSAY